MNYTFLDFQKEFPNEDACLEYIFKKQFPNHKDWYRVKGRKAYADKSGKQVFPLTGTIFANSNISLLKWFYVIYLFSKSKTGISGKEIQRQIGCTYKCAWRVGHKVRELMHQKGGKLKGVVEVDETYIGGKNPAWMRGKKIPVMGIVERGGRVRAQVIEREDGQMLDMIRKNVEVGATIMSDALSAYRKTTKLGYKHEFVNHWKREYARNGVSTNSIEGVWSQLKGTIKGTYKQVSKKHLQSYVDASVFSYNYRGKETFYVLLGRI